jgi:hypothetical protein
MGHLTDIQSMVKRAFDLQGAVPAEIDLGSPRNPDCLNFGICRINFWNGQAFNLLPSCCPSRAQGYIRNWEQRGIELIFPKENMAPATLEKHFGSGLFTVEVTYPLSLDMASRLDIVGFDFQPGSYPILEMNGNLHLIFA